MTDTLLDVKDLICGYDGIPVLKGINFSVQAGETVLLAGPNGCGKSTLLKAVIGALSLIEGDVIFRGISLTGKSAEERVRMGIGYLRQTDNIFPGQTVKDNLMLAGMSLTKSEFSTRRDKMLNLFDSLPQKLEQRAGLLSGGQRQSLSLAMVFMRPARLYLLDEPTAGLSPKAAQDVMERIHCFAKDDGSRAILMVEHRLDLIGWIDHAVFLSQGRVKSETSNQRQFLDAAWLSRNYFE